jgi:hypothetical protein
MRSYVQISCIAFNRGDHTLATGVCLIIVFLSNNTYIISKPCKLNIKSSAESGYVFTLIFFRKVRTLPLMNK